MNRSEKLLKHLKQTNYVQVSNCYVVNRTKVGKKPTRRDTHIYVVMNLIEPESSKDSEYIMVASYLKCYKKKLGFVPEINTNEMIDIQPYQDSQPSGWLAYETQEFYDKKKPLKSYSDSDKDQYGVLYYHMVQKELLDEDSFVSPLGVEQPCQFNTQLRNLFFNFSQIENEMFQCGIEEELEAGDDADQDLLDYCNIVRLDIELRALSLITIEEFDVNISHGPSKETMLHSMCQVGSLLAVRILV